MSDNIFNIGKSELPTYFQISNGGDFLVKIHMDGKIEFGPNYTPDEAARIFWEAIGHRAPDSNNNRIKKLETAILDLDYLWSDNLRWALAHYDILKTIPGYQGPTPERFGT